MSSKLLVSLLTFLGISWSQSSNAAVLSAWGDTFQHDNGALFSMRPEITPGGDFAGDRPLAMRFGDSARRDDDDIAIHDAGRAAWIANSRRNHAARPLVWPTTNPT